MLDFHGTVKILDFGIARVSHLVRDTRTQVGLMKGKVAYMSPEQVELGEIDHRSDLFAVGIVLHELLTGRRLFRSNTDYATSRMVLELKIPPPSMFNASVPPALDQIVMRALERDKDARYQSAGAMVSDLERVIQEQRLSPREHLKLLCELFPEGQANDKSVSPITGSFSSTTAARRATAEKATSPGTPAELMRDDAVTASSPSFARRLAASPAAVRGPDDSSLYPPPLRPVADDSRRRVPWAAAAVGGAIVVAIVVALLTRDHSPRASGQGRRRAGREQSSEAGGDRDGASVRRFEPARRRGNRRRLRQVAGTNAVHGHVEPRHDGADLPFRQGRAPAGALQDHSRSRQGRPRRPAAGSAGERARQGRTGPGGSRAAREEEEPVSAPKATRAPVAVPASKDCLLTVGSVPWAELWIDGKDVGQPTPVVHLPVTCGAHKLRFKRSNPDIDHVESVNLSPGQELKKNFNLETADQDG